MTNEEINKIQGKYPLIELCEKCSIEFKEHDDYVLFCYEIRKIRADERERVIREIEGLIQTWAESEQNNSFPQDSLYWGGWWSMADIIASKLNSLREAK